MKVTEEKDSLALQPTRLTTHEGSMQGTISEDKKLPVIKNGPTGVLFTNDIACSGSEDTPGKLRNTTTDNQVTFLFQLPLAFPFCFL